MKLQPKQQAKQRRSQVHIKIDNGHFQILGLGAWHSYLRDPYHLLLTISWGVFFGFIVFAYLMTNALFALAYLIGGNNISHARPGSFPDAFFFSVQTLASIGYGDMYPQTTYANIIVTIEAMVGLVGIAVMTGLAFARFSQPTARILFSNVAVIMPYDGVPTLMFRTANQRRNLILEAKMRVSLLRDEISLEGHSMRRLHDLKLLRNWTPIFSLSWTLMHPIDEFSPLYGFTEESLFQTKSLIVISLSGIDETVSQMLHVRYSYAAHDILLNKKFVDIFHQTADANRYMDYTNFHDVEPLDLETKSD